MNDNQARIDPEVRDAIIAYHHPSIPVIREMAVEDARDFLELFVQQNPQTRHEVGSVHDLMVDGGADRIPARLYIPQDRPGPHPTLVWFHGGGWVLGSIDGCDPSARLLCRNSGAAVLSVDYRLAPEHPWPAAAEDACAALRWVRAHGAELDLDIERLAVGGDSAGGNLAAICALEARDGEGPALRGQLLVYPVVDHDLDRPSYRTYAEGLLLETEDMDWFWNHYCPDVTMRDDWRVSPLKAATLRGLPPAVVVVADLDPLRSEVEHYAERLNEEGVEAELLRYEDLPHGAFGMTDNCEAVRQVNREASERLARLLGTTPIS